MRYSKGHRKNTHENILREAAQAFQEEGSEKISLSTLMRRLGLTNGGFYTHFKSKEDLVGQAIDEMLLKSRARFLAFNHGCLASQAIEDYLDFYLSLNHAKDRSFGCSLPSLSSDVARMGIDMKKKVAQSLDTLRNDAAALLVDMGFERHQALEMASSMFSELVGAVSLARIAITPEQAQETLDLSKHAIRQRLGLTSSPYPRKTLGEKA